MAASSTLSDILQRISTEKIGELEKRRAIWNDRYENIRRESEASGKPSAVRSLMKLLHGISSMPDQPEYDQELHNTFRFLEQAWHDPSIPQEKLQAIHKRLQCRLDVGKRKLDLAHLYSRLWVESIEPTASPASESTDLVGESSDDSLDIVESAKQEQVHDDFAHFALQPLDTGETAIQNYLHGLFASEYGAKTLKRMRALVAERGEAMFGESFCIDEQDLKWCIRALLKNQLMTDEKKTTLNDFLNDQAVLKEVADVLNMRLRDIKAWDWNLGDRGIPVIQRQGLNGKWRVLMDEDVLQALLIQWIGTCWAVYTKEILKSTRRSRTLWKQPLRLSYEEATKLEYYLEHDCDTPNAASERLKTYVQNFFLAPLPDKFLEEAVGYDDDDDDDTDPDGKTPKDVKQLLLRTLATEALLHRSLDGEVAVLRSDFRAFGNSLSHSTIFAVMRFIGYHDDWISFFTKVLEPPLDMLDGSPIRPRKRGLPLANVVEKLLGEVVLFFMDLAVAQNDGMILYRFHDDLWLVGKPAQVAKSWETMRQFAKVMGLEFNEGKTGSVYIVSNDRKRDPSLESMLPKGEVGMYFLRLDEQTGNWNIDQERVQEHVRQLEKRLNESKGVLQWIKTWNTCMGRFFSYTFGESAYCFGEAHVDATLSTHKSIQESIFPGSTVVEHIRNMIVSRFPDAQDIPDAFIRMPESMGGLGLKNPFIPLLLLKQGMRDSTEEPEKCISEFSAQERMDFDEAKNDFQCRSERERRKQYKEAFPSEQYDEETSAPPLSWEQAQTFLTFEEYTANRALTSESLCDLYKHLLSQPKPSGVEMNDAVSRGLKSFRSRGGRRLSGVRHPTWAKELDPETLWTVQSLEDELETLFGGLEVVDMSLLPVGVFQALRERKVSW